MSVSASHPGHDMEQERRIGTIDDVLVFLPLPRSSVYELARHDRIPGVVRVGRRMLFDLVVLRRWVEAGGSAAEERQ